MGLAVGLDHIRLGLRRQWEIDTRKTQKAKVGMKPLHLGRSLSQVNIDKAVRIEVGAAVSEDEPQIIRH